MKKIYRVFEEETDNTSTESKNSSLNNASTQNVQKQTAISKLLLDVAELQGKISAAKREYDRQVNTIQQQIDIKKKQLAGLGYISESISESQLEYIKSKKLFESAQLSKADELCAAITAANDKIETLSYHIDTKSAMLFARKILAFINDKYWNDGENHWDDIEEYFRSIILKSSISLSRRELNQFLEEFKNILKNNTAYRWIFGNESTGKATTEQLSEGFFNRKKQNSLDNLPDEIPHELKIEVYSLGHQIIYDLEDYTDENEVYDYFKYGADEFWEAFDNIYDNDSDDSDYYDSRLDLMWNKWKDEIMHIISIIHKTRNLK